MAPHAHIIKHQGHTGRHEACELGMNIGVRVGTAGMLTWAQKVIPWRLCKKLFPIVQQNVLFSPGMAQKDIAQDAPGDAERHRVG